YFLNDTNISKNITLSLHDALPIYEDITNAIQQTDQSATLGTFKDEDDAVLRWNTDLKDVQQIKDIPLATETGDISLSDVAKIKEVKKDQTAMAWKNGDADFLL